MPDGLAMPGPGVFIPWPDATRLELPLDSVKVSAGFPSPAADYEERRLDINDYLIRNPVSTFFFPVEGDSMEGAEIFDGDILVVDKSVPARHGHVVVAFVNGERLVKRLCNRNGRVALLAENPRYPALDIQEGMELVIWGVVIGKFKWLTSCVVATIRHRHGDPNAGLRPGRLQQLLRVLREALRSVPDPQAGGAVNHNVLQAKGVTPMQKSFLL